MASPRCKSWIWRLAFNHPRNISLFICYGFALLSLEFWSCFEGKFTFYLLWLRLLDMLAFAVIFFDMDGSRCSCCSGDVRSVLFKLFNLGIGFKFEFWIWWSLSFCLIEDLSLSLSFCLREDLREERKKKEKRKTGYRWLKKFHS